MKRIIYLLLILVATCGTSCARDYCNPPCDPYYNGNTYNPGGGGQTEGNNPNVDNSDANPMVCEDYYNRYQLADGINIFLSDYGTLYWYDAATETCPKICWADLSLRREGYFIVVYRLLRGEMRQVDALDTREVFDIKYDVLLCDPRSPDYLYPRKVEIERIGYTGLKVLLLSPTDQRIADEYFYM